jgi:predicted Fe-Mo cluster-binding NifX family protein
MRIAISADGSNLDVNVSNRFITAKYLVIVDLVIPAIIASVVVRFSVSVFPPTRVE